MMFDSVRDDLRATLDEIRAAGLHKPERVLGTPQSATVHVTAGGRPGEVLNFCANNYLGLADHPEVVAAAHAALDRWGYGMASVRFICGTQEVHKELEARLAAFLGQEDTILYSSIAEGARDDVDAVHDWSRRTTCASGSPRTPPCSAAG
jgi:glycine C-acetyltransferase